MYIICMYVYNLLCNIFVIMSLEGGNIVFMITSRLGLSYSCESWAACVDHCVDDDQLWPLYISYIYRYIYIYIYIYIYTYIYIYYTQLL